MLHCLYCWLLCISLSIWLILCCQKKKDKKPSVDEIIKQAGCWFSRAVDPFINVKNAIIVGMNGSDEDGGDEEEEGGDKEEDNNDEATMDKSNEEDSLDTPYMQAASNSAHSDDTGKFQEARACRQVYMEAVQNGEISNEWWCLPLFLFDEDLIKQDNLTAGLFHGYVLFFCHIFLGSGLPERQGKTNGCDMVVTRHAMTTVTGHHIAYAATQAHYCMGAVKKWQQFDGGFDLWCFFWSIVDFFEGADKDDNADEILVWWNKYMLVFFGKWSNIIGAERKNVVKRRRPVKKRRSWKIIKCSSPARSTFKSLNDIPQRLPSNLIPDPLNVPLIKALPPGRLNVPCGCLLDSAVVLGPLDVLCTLDNALAHALVNETKLLPKNFVLLQHILVPTVRPVTPALEIVLQHCIMRPLTQNLPLPMRRSSVFGTIKEVHHNLMNPTRLRRPVVIIITLDHLQESLAQVESTGMLLQSWKLLLAKQRTDVAFLRTMRQSDRNHQRRGRRTESDVCNAVCRLDLVTRLDQSHLARKALQGLAKERHIYDQAQVTNRTP
ncbi:hypothetical protein ARMGADRAFT_1035815 [Armillaria gallica]|uniref:Uncharacterized protein n=1 Tax=Armillaria gallica TaxID=47427 RepID=A0A2H3D5K1_ARMGA|nr:hypothetical protein ARMGADRAFT_1035815 [Armillaria gallica]